MKRSNNSQTGFGLIGFLLALVIVGLVFGAGGYVYNSRQPKPVAPSKLYPNSSGKVTFEGKVEGKNDGCASDGECSIIVDGKKVITGSGLSTNQQENIFGTQDKVQVGTPVLVKALHDKNGYTLQRCYDCYILQKLPNEPGKPKIIVKTFCSDVCPQYTRSYLVFDGVEKEECDKIGGLVLSDYAWGGYIGCGARGGEE